MDTVRPPELVKRRGRFLVEFSRHPSREVLLVKRRAAVENVSGRVGAVVAEATVQPLDNARSTGLREVVPRIAKQMAISSIEILIFQGQFSILS